MWGVQCTCLPTCIAAAWYALSCLCQLLQGCCPLKLHQVCSEPVACLPACLPACLHTWLAAVHRWEEAAADYQAVLAVAPNDPVPWNNLGW